MGIELEWPIGFVYKILSMNSCKYYYTVMKQSIPFFYLSN